MDEQKTMVHKLTNGTWWYHFIEEGDMIRVACYMDYDVHNERGGTWTRKVAREVWKNLLADGYRIAEA